MTGSIGISLALVIELPISNAIDEAPNRLYVIYQASVTFFAAVIAFQLLFRQRNTIFSVIVKAVNMSTNQNDPVIQLDDNKPWKDLSEKEKEFRVAKVVLSHYVNNRQLPGSCTTNATTLSTNDEEDISVHSNVS